MRKHSKQPIDVAQEREELQDIQELQEPQEPRAAYGKTGNLHDFTGSKVPTPNFALMWESKGYTGILKHDKTFQAPKCEHDTKGM